MPYRFEVWNGSTWEDSINNEDANGFATLEDLLASNPVIQSESKYRLVKWTLPQDDPVELKVTQVPEHKITFIQAIRSLFDPMGLVPAKDFSEGTETLSMTNTQAIVVETLLSFDHGQCVRVVHVPVCEVLE